MEQQHWQNGPKPKMNQMENYLKYNTFYQEAHPPRKLERDQKASFYSGNFLYNPERDTFTCPAHQFLISRGIHPCRSENGYLGVPMPRAKRRIQVSLKLRKYRRQAKENLLSDQGITLRKQHCIEPENTFGDVKHNVDFRRFHLRGLEKVKNEETEQYWKTKLSEIVGGEFNDVQSGGAANFLKSLHTEIILFVEANYRHR